MAGSCSRIFSNAVLRFWAAPVSTFELLAISRSAALAAPDAQGSRDCDRSVAVPEVPNGAGVRSDAGSEGHVAMCVQVGGGDDFDSQKGTAILAAVDLEV